MEPILQQIGGYKWGASISKMDTGLGAGFRQSNIANPYIQWEKQEQFNIGLDMSVFNIADITVDVYDKTSHDMLMPLQLPSYMGTRGNGASALAAPWGNFGEINNKGLEIAVNLLISIPESRFVPNNDIINGSTAA